MMLPHCLVGATSFMLPVDNHDHPLNLVQTCLFGIIYQILVYEEYGYM